MIPKKLLDELERWIAQKKFGDISIKFNAGHIVHITRTESIKVEFKSNDSGTSITATVTEVDS